MIELVKHCRIKDNQHFAPGLPKIHNFLLFVVSFILIQSTPDVFHNFDLLNSILLFPGDIMMITNQTVQEMCIALLKSDSDLDNTV